MKIMRAWIGFALVIALVAGNIGGPSPVRAETEEDFKNSRELALAFDDSVSDSSGKKVLTVFNGTASYEEGIRGKALLFNGKDNYIDLGTSPSLQPADLTVSCWIKPEGVLSGEHMLVWNKPSGNWAGNGWYLSAYNEDSAILLSVGANQEEAYVQAPRSEFFPANVWTHLVVTYNGATKEVCFYRNGVAQKVTYRKSFTNSIVADDTSHKWLGFNSPGYNGAYIKMALDEFEIYSKAATPEQAAALYDQYGITIDPETILQQDYNNLNFSITSVKSNLSLPTVGAAGSKISWESSAPEYISNVGAVTRPTLGEADTQVTLTAKLAYKEKTMTKKFTLTVEAEKSYVALKDFPMDAVVVTDDYYENALSLEVNYLNSFEADRLVSGFLKTKGLEAKATMYPGWESMEIRGHTLGHYLAAVSQAYVNTKNPELLEKLNYIIDELERSQLDSGYLSAFPEYYYDNVEQNKPCWVPWYTMHKIINGLLDVYKLTGNDKALTIVTKLGDWVYDRTSKWSAQTQNTVLAVEYGGMNDCMYELYKITGDEKHAKAAHMFDETHLFTSIQQGEDVLNGKHANTTIPKFMGALNRYLALGKSEEFYLEAAENFWDMVVNNHTYITGGNSEWEHFGAPGVLDAERTNSNNETCNTYNMLKLSRELFKLTQDVKYADYYENTLINAILSSQNPETGMTMYFQPMASGYFKVYGSDFSHFWCCTGTGMENFTKLNDSIYFHSTDDLYVNQYLSSEVTWKDKNLKLVQETDIPNTDLVTFTIETLDGKSTDAAIRLRIPDWIAGEPVVTINGRAADTLTENNYLVVKNSWTDGDRMELTLPMQVLAYNLPDGSNTLAFKYGPVVLSAGMGKEDMTISTTGVNVSVPKAVAVKDTITINSGSVQEWLTGLGNNVVKTEGKLEFKLLNTDAGELVFTPHYRQYQQRYGIYWRFAGVADLDSAEGQAKILADKERARLEKVTLDSLPVGNDQYEAQHNIQGESTSTGTFKGSTYRDAKANGWFSYDLKVDPNNKNYLYVTYYSGDVGRTFNIYVDDTLLEEITLENPNPDNFYVKTYFIPSELVAGKDLISVKFETRGSSFAGGIFDILRVITDYDTNSQLKELNFDIGALSEAFSGAKAEYTLTVPRDTNQITMSAVLSDVNGLLYVGDILVDDTLPRDITLQEDTTEILLISKAEDHVTEHKYVIKIMKSDTADIDVVESMKPNPVELQEDTKDPSHGWIIVIILAALVLALGALALIIRRRSIGKKRKED